MNISIIVPTYNRPQALKLCIRSLAVQSVLPTEIIIADDGSGEETRRVIQAMRADLGHIIPIEHAWQEDKGFRKPMILNEAVRRSHGEYLIFIDGDCMAHRNYVEAHLLKSDPNAILSGKRVDIGKQLTEKLLQEEELLTKASWRLVLDSVVGDSRKIEESFPIRSTWLRQLMHRDHISDDGVWGCNFSLYKNLFIAINGCDEEFLDGSLEDNDLGIRVLNQGKRLMSVRGLAIIFHLWHTSSWSFESSKYAENLKIIKKRIELKEGTCRNGYVKIR